LKQTKTSTTKMTRFSTAAGFVAALVWLGVASNGCEAALVQGRSAATAAMVEERRSLADQAGRKNLRPTEGKKELDGLEGAENEAAKHRVMRHEATGSGGGDGTGSGKTLGGSSMQSKRMTKERTVDWARQLGVSQKDVDQLVKAYDAKEANLATRARFLAKRHSDETDNHVKGPRKLVQHSNKAFKTPASSSSSTPSFLDAMRKKSSQVSPSSRAASSTSNISPSHQRDLLRKTEEAGINDACSDSNPTLVVGGAMVSGSLEGAQSYPAESCAGPSGNTGLWCK
jgi:hypothetical protein